MSSIRNRPEGLSASEIDKCTWKYYPDSLIQVVANGPLLVGDLEGVPLDVRVG